MSSDDADGRRRTWIEAARFPSRNFDGRGIVICAGGARVFTCAYVLISVLRKKLECSLPIEVWHYGAEEMSRSMRLALEELHVHLIDAQQVMDHHPARISDGWQLKAYALLHSRFAEVLMLDADQVPVCDPSPLFGWPEFRETGAVFWPDLVDLRADNPVWTVCGLEPSRRPSLDSGQILVDKRRTLPALALALLMNEDGSEVLQHVYGDKDTFLLAFAILDHAAKLVPHRPFAADDSLVQRDFAGTPLFQHRTAAKWIYGARVQPHMPGEVHRDACTRALEDLADRWCGLIVPEPNRGPAARAAEDQLAGAVYDLVRPGRPAQRLRLLPAGELDAESRRSGLRGWHLDGDAGEFLVMTDPFRSVLRLERDPRGGFSGQDDDGLQVILLPPTGQKGSRATRKPPQAPPGVLEAGYQPFWTSDQ
jgi:hypothetical protein